MSEWRESRIGTADFVVAGGRAVCGVRGQRLDSALNATRRRAGSPDASAAWRYASPALAR